MAREAVLALLREARETSDQKGQVEAYLKAIDAAVAGEPGATEDTIVENCTEVTKQGKDRVRNTHTHTRA